MTIKKWIIQDLIYIHRTKRSDDGSTETKIKIHPAIIIGIIILGLRIFFS
jgi:hypothetical protein